MLLLRHKVTTHVNFVVVPLTKTINPGTRSAGFPNPDAPSIRIFNPPLQIRPNNSRITNPHIRSGWIRKPTRTDWGIHSNGEIHPNGVAGLSILHERIDSSQNLRNTKQPLNAQRLRAACGSAGPAAWIRLQTCSLGLSKKSTRTEPWLE